MVATGRKMLGETDPVSCIVIVKLNIKSQHVFFLSLALTLFPQAKSNPGTIRGDFCIHIGR